MFIRVKNANEVMRGDPLVINTNNITSVYSYTSKEDDKTMTIICSHDEKLSWAVLESVEEVYALLREATSK